MARLKPKSPYIHSDVEFIDSTVGRYCEIGRGSRINNSIIGDYSYCDRYTDIANASVGKFSNIASFVRIGASDHPLDRASLHHFQYRSDDYWDNAAADNAWFEKRENRISYIGHDTWLGHNAQIKPDITIGHGAVIASGAVVTKSVSPYTIVAGVPAKPLRVRLARRLANKMIELAWWDWDHDKIEECLPDFRNLSVEAFIYKYG
ncbi:chloramphenicol acetyltransferase [Rhodobacterales bacterium FZCC0083]|nr:chloramphenicol acetyltransferase [Alphaproteobacteria bacterium]WRQ45994.1 chloramphenicol acetyltransferase [Rhodobacterales bacterium FZCC0083]